VISVAGMADTIWTEADRDKLAKAIASGVLTVKYDGGDGSPKREITYQSLAAMRALLAEMRRELSGTTSYRLASIRKGFGE
jgi:hypothetical protein